MSNDPSRVYTQPAHDEDTRARFRFDVLSALDAQEVEPGKLGARPDGHLAKAALDAADKAFQKFGPALSVITVGSPQWAAVVSLVAATIHGMNGVVNAN